MISPIHTAAATRVHPLATLVAADDSDAAGAAIRVAVELAAAGRIAPQVIVVDPTSAATRMPAGINSSELARTRDTSNDASQHATAIRSVLGAAGGGNWPLWLRAGDPVTQIVHDAVHGQFQLLVMGLRHHDAASRLAKRDTTLRVTRLSAVPVFAVTYWLHHVPRRIVVGLDFSLSSQRAAGIACRILADGGILTLAYAEKPFDEDAGRVVRVHPDSVHTELASVIDQLPLPSGAQVETAPLVGSPATELLNIADRVGADAIAVGHQRHSLTELLRSGSVSADLIGSAQYPVLVTPAP